MSKPVKKKVMILTKPIPSPAQQIVQKLAAYKKQDAKIQWFLGLPEKWLEDCICDGLQHFLQTRGYVLRFNIEDTVRCLRQWAFAHVWQTKYTTEKTYLNYMVSPLGNKDDHDFFCMKVDAFDCTEFMDAWTSNDFFDDSRVGHEQRMDFQQFLWHIVDLERSKTHRKWRETQMDEDRDENTYEYSHHDDGSGAYGGDRRTY
jgi:hypothetical protein